MATRDDEDDTSPREEEIRLWRGDDHWVDCFRDGVEGERVWQSPDFGAPVFSNLVLAHAHVSLPYAGDGHPARTGYVDRRDCLERRTECY